VCTSILLKGEPDTNVKFSILTQYLLEKEGSTSDECYEIPGEYSLSVDSDKEGQYMDLQASNHARRYHISFGKHPNSNIELSFILCHCLRFKRGRRMIRKVKMFFQNLWVDIFCRWSYCAAWSPISGREGGGGGGVLIIPQHCIEYIYLSLHTL
jgi:hypothetical protein